MHPSDSISDEQLMEMLDGGIAVFDDPSLAVMVIADTSNQTTGIVVHNVEVWTLYPEQNEAPVSYAHRVDQARLLAQRVVDRMTRMTKKDS